MTTEAYREGKKAFNMDKRLEDNPYSPNTEQAVHWAAGWLDADQVENREYIGLGSSNVRQW